MVEVVDSLDSLAGSQSGHLFVYLITSCQANQLLVSQDDSQLGYWSVKSCYGSVRLLVNLVTGQSSYRVFVCQVIGRLVRLMISQLVNQSNKWLVCLI